MKKSTVITLLSLGIALGACAREVVRTVTPGSALAQAGHRYKVVGASMSTGGAEEDLNTYSAQGWHYVGTIGAALVFER